MIYIGIDPGKDGAIAVLDDDGLLWRLIDMPENIGTDLYKFLKESIELSVYKKAVAFVEASQVMPGQGIKSGFTYGKGYGEIIAVLKILEIPFQEIHPLTWKKEFKLIKKDKAESIKVAEQMYPSVTIPFKTERGKLLDGRAEALLIAEYCRRKCK